MNVGDTVSYRFESRGKGASAKAVVVESAAKMVNVTPGGRETGVVKTWRDEKGFGFIGRDEVDLSKCVPHVRLLVAQSNHDSCSVFCHSKDIQVVSTLTVGSRVSFRYEETAKGGGAKDVRVEEATPAAEESQREIGTVKSWNAEKGFGFIGWSGDKE